MPTEQLQECVKQESLTSFVDGALDQCDVAIETLRVIVNKLRPQPVQTGSISEPKQGVPALSMDAKLYQLRKMCNTARILSQDIEDII